MGIRQIEVVHALRARRSAARLQRLRDDLASGTATQRDSRQCVGIGALQRGTGVVSTQALVSGTNGQLLRGFATPEIRSGDYPAAAMDPDTGVFWGASEQGTTAPATNSLQNNWGTVIWKATFN